MEDRVGDLLAERAALDTGAAGGIILSVLLHAAITAIAVYAALHHPPPQEVQMVNIRLAPMTPANVAPARKGTPAAPKPVPKLTEPQPIVEKPKAPVIAKPSKKTAPTSPFGKSTKKGADVIPPPPPTTVHGTATGTGAGGATGVADVPIGSAGVTGIEGDFPYTLYIERMKQLIGTHWFRPQVAPGTTTTIYYEIQRDGTIRNAKIETASGNGMADRAALRAILEASPLPPLPFGYGGTYLGVHLTFK